jgi:hypothetical protein
MKKGLSPDPPCAARESKGRDRPRKVDVVPVVRVYGFEFQVVRIKNIYVRGLGRPDDTGQHTTVARKDRRVE